MMRLLVSFAILAATAEAGSPVGKVLELLGNLKDKVTEEGNVAAKEHKEFTEYCRSMKQDLEHSISRNNDKIDEFAATLQKANSEIERLTAEISDLAAKIQQEEEDLSKAKALRKEQNDDFLSGQKDLEDTVDTLVRAVGLLRKAGLGFIQAPQMKAVLAQVAETLSTVMDAAVIDTASKEKLQAMLQEHDDGDDEGAAGGFQQPQAKAYESHSGNIIEMIEELKLKAEGELSDLRKEEMQRQHAFDQLEQGLADSINTANRDRKNNQNALAQNQETAGKSEGDHANEKNSLSQNDESLKTSTEQCAQRSEDFKAEVASREEELGAIGKAIEILSDPTFASANSARTSFLQVRDDRRQGAVDEIRGLARQFRSVGLAQLAIRAAEDPFGKVKGLIREMIDRLKKKAAEEADHNAYCVSERKTNVEKRDDVQGKRDGFAARLEKAQATQAQLKEEVAALSGELADLEANTAEATKIRTEEEASYNTAAEEFRVGLDGLQKATQVLREYYSQGGAHNKASDSATGIIGMLEVAEQDMSNSQAQAEMAETNAARDYKKMMQESEVNKATMQASVKSKEGELARLAESITDLQSDVDGADEELKAILDYLEKLKESCTHKPQSFEDRAAARQQEIEGLKRALEILDNETAGGAEFLQRK